MLILWNDFKYAGEISECSNLQCTYPMNILFIACPKAIVECLIVLVMTTFSYMIF